MNNPMPEERARSLVFFSAVDRHSASFVGGKAANLGELERAGLPVPPGFVLTTIAYKAAAEAANLPAILGRLGSTSDATSDAARLAEVASAARAALVQAPMPPEIRAELARAYAELGGGEAAGAVAVAVRSSATAEDLAFASFAGQQDTYLNIIGLAALEDAVRRCWASLWTERAVKYRAAVGVDHRTAQLAVVVQRMLDPKVAGVLFTANPITGRRKQSVIDASYGLGEAVVSGAVNPDHFVVDTSSARVLERRLGDKRVAVRPAAGGGVEHVTAPAAGACLSDPELADLARLGAAVEAHYGSPQDIEFALDNEGRLWLTQSRPITTLFPLQAGAPDPDRELRVYFSATADEGVVRPITPMGLQAFRLLGSAWADLLWDACPKDRAAGPAIMIELAQRLYYDITPILRSDLARRGLLLLLGSTETYTQAIVAGLIADPRLTPERTSIREAARLLIDPIRRTRVVARLVRALANPTLARRRSEAEIDAIFEEHARTSASARSPEEQLDRLESLLFDVFRAIPLTDMIVPAAGILASELAGAALGGRATPDELQAALRGLPGNPTTEMNLALWSVARAVRADEASSKALCDQEPAALTKAYQAGALPAAAQRALADLLAAYGHRAVAEVDLGLPRWSEDPTHLFSVLKNNLRQADPAAAPDAQFQRAAAAGEATAAELSARAASISALHGAAARFGLDRARALTGSREAWKDHLSRLYARSRALLRAVGEALAAGERLDREDDIFFLSLHEARSALRGADLREVVRARREEYGRELERRRVPSILLSDGTEPAPAASAAREDDEPSALRGTAASPGKARGRARVILDPEGAHIEPGEILVAPTTDPGWTPLFMTVAGLVMERGGAMSHGAVVAREFGIPAVVGVAGATTRIVTGQEIEVDGTAGRVRA